MTFGPIVLIEDDIDDQEMFQLILEELNINFPVTIYDTPQEAMEFLLRTKEKPFLIICDVNLPKQNGLEFKKVLDANPILRKKSIPFIFYTTSVNQLAVNDAYAELSVQGYFQKGFTLQEIRETIRVIFDYWTLCKHPNE